MPWPWNKPELEVKPRKYKPQDLEKKIQKKKNDEFLKLIDEDPEIKRQWLAKEFNVTLPQRESESETIKKIKQQKKEELLQVGLSLLDQNPELKEQLATEAVTELLGSKTKREEYVKQGGPSELMDTLDMIDSIKERMGAGDGRLIDSSVIKALLENLPALLSYLRGGETPQLPPARMYVVETPQGLVEMDAVNYKAFLESKTRERIVAQSQPKIAPQPKIEPKPEPPKAEVKPKPEVKNDLSAAPKEEVKSPPVIQVDTNKSLGLADMIGWVDLDPQDYVDNLLQNDDENSRFIINFFRSNTADSFIQAIQQFKTNEEYKPMVETIEQHRDWVSGVIELLQ